MSQMSGVVGDGSAAQIKGTSTGRAVLLLAIAVVVGTAILHGLDKAPAAPASHVAAKTMGNSMAMAPATPTTLQARSPADVKVLVANGVGVAGAASKVAGRLQPIGYQLLKPGNTAKPQASSSVEYLPGYEAEAQAVATSLGISNTAVQALPTPSPVGDLQATNVLVIVGTDLASPAAAPAGAGTPTTAAAPSSQASQTNTGLNGPLGRVQTPLTTQPASASGSNTPAQH